MPRAARPFKRQGSPYWWITVPDIDQGGRRVKRSSGTADYEEACAIQRRRQQEWHQLKQHGIKPSRTVDEVILHFLRDTAPDKRGSTLERLGWAGKQVQRLLGGRTVQSLTEADVAQYKLTRRTDGVGNDTIAKELGLLSSGIKHCNHEYGWDLPNVLIGRIPAASKGRTRWLKPHEAQRLIAAADARVRAPWLGDIVRVMLNTGMRPGEILGLEVSRIDELRRVIYFDAEDSKNDEPAIVPLNTEAWAAIQRRLEWQRGRGLSSDYVFCGYDGRRIGSIKTAWKNTLADAGITNFKRHDLRHTAASWLAQMGYSAEKIGKLLRQRDSRSTARYVHMRNQDAVEMSGALESFGTFMGQTKEKARDERA